MEHGAPYPKPPALDDPVAMRISSLSAEYLDATASRREEIAQEILALRAGRITPLRPAAR